MQTESQDWLKQIDKHLLNLRKILCLPLQSTTTPIARSVPVATFSIKGNACRKPKRKWRKQYENKV